MDLFEWAAKNRAPGNLLPPTNDARPVSEAREHIRGILWEGGSPSCPCCDRKASLRRRGLNDGMASVLIMMAQRALAEGEPEEGSHTWLTIRDIFGSRRQDRRDWTQLRHWGLICPFEKKTATDNSRGIWRITDKGWKFSVNLLEVPAAVYLYNDEVILFDEEVTAISGVLKTPFDYELLISAKVNGSWFGGSGDGAD